MNHLELRLSTVVLFCTVFAIVVSLSPAQQPQHVAAQSPPPDISAGDAAFQRQDWIAAAEHYRQAMDDGVSHPLVPMRLGFSLHMLGRYEEAMPWHLRAAAATHPEIRIDGLFNAACASSRLGDIDKALAYLAKAIDAGFADVAQVENDADLDSLRNDDRFKSMIAGIGSAPRLHQIMDFLLGDWSHDNQRGEVVQLLNVTRPLDGSHAFLSTLTHKGGGQWTGLLWPDSEKRQWRWTQVDGLGTSRELIGTATPDHGMLFVGKEMTPVGPNVSLRLSYVPQPDGSVLAKAEVSTDDGKTWSIQHEAKFVRRETCSGHDHGQHTEDPETRH